MSSVAGGCTHPGSRNALRQVASPIEKVVADEAQSTHLIIIGQAGSSASREAQAALKTAIFMERPAPVIVVPPVCPVILGDHAAIAWEDSASVRKAVAGMLPILLTCRRITLLMGEEGDAAEPPRAFLGAMEQARVPVTVRRFALHGRTIGLALVQEAEAVQVDFLVMGAFSHTRFIEWVFGDATVDVIADLSIPIAIHH